jgi:hypothetical protein
MKSFFKLFILCFYLCGCSTHLTDISMISNKNISLSELNIDHLKKTKNVEGEDKVFIFLIIPFGRPTLQEAVNQALDKGKGDLMIDASVYSTGWWFIIGEAGVKIKGTVVNTKEERR